MGWLGFSVAEFVLLLALYFVLNLVPLFGLLYACVGCC